MSTRENMFELTTRPDEMQAGIICSVLEEAGIKSYTAVAGGVMANAEFGLTFVPTSIYVDPSDAERARAAIENTREESVDLDWSEVDVGDEATRDAMEREISKNHAIPRTSTGFALAIAAFFVLLVVLCLFMLGVLGWLKNGLDI